MRFSRVGIGGKVTCSNTAATFCLRWIESVSIIRIFEKEIVAL